MIELIQMSIDKRGNNLMLINFNLKDQMKFSPSIFHVLGLLFAGIGTGLALVYGSADQYEHSLLKDWQTYLIFFVIFLGAVIGKFTKS